MAAALAATTLLSGLVAGLLGVTASDSATGCPWVASHASPARRAAMLLARMSLSEELHMMAGTRHPRGVQTNGYIAPIPRLCIPALTMIGGPAGLHYNPSNTSPRAATALPAPIGLAASFDTALARRYGAVIGQEARAQGQDIVFSPMVNIVRVPQMGRAFETFGEDPLLNGAMGAAEVGGIQRQGVGADVKHFVATNQSTDRKSLDAVVDPRVLHEIYLPAFRTAVQRGKPVSVMCAYDSVDGGFNCGNRPLLGDVLRRDWGFGGLVLSDFPATHSTVRSVKAGLEIELPFGHYYTEQALRAAIHAGSIDRADVDEHVRRILTQMFRLGLFHRSHRLAAIPVNAHARVAQRVAERSMVLLANRHHALPLATSVGSVAVIGPYAAAAKTGGGGSSRVRPFYSVSPVEAIKQRLGGHAVVDYVRGTSGSGLPAIPTTAVSPPGHPHQTGLRGQYFTNPDLRGRPTMTRTDDAIGFRWGPGAPAPGFPADGFSVRWTGTLQVPVSGDYTMSTTSGGASRVLIDHRLVVDNPGTGPGTREGTVHLRSGHRYRLRVEYRAGTGPAGVSVGWRTPGPDPSPLQRAVAAAKAADVAVVMVGDSRTENADRPTIALTDEENHLVEAVAAANPRTIVVVKSGGPVLMPWADKVAGILEAWYPGQQDGSAVASVLFGDVNPSGKLPVTFPAGPTDTPTQTPDQYPGVGLRVHYTEGLDVGYRWYDANRRRPMFPFGYGLSYTSFSVHDLSVREPRPSSFVVRAKVTNTGERAGAEVVQLYVRYPDGVGEPPRQLRGFRRVSLAPGQTRQVTFQVGRRGLSYWDDGLRRWVLPPGRFQLLVGTSSRDLPLHRTVTVRAPFRGDVGTALALQANSSGW